jgi:type IV pilus assembly protein PilN
MARINLLPWREAERRRRQREFAAIAAASLVATLILGLAVHMQVQMLISYQQSRNQFLKGEISVLDKKIKEINEIERTRNRLISRMNVIQQLQQSRPEIVHLFDELVTRIPPGVYLTQISQSGGSITVNGRAQSNARVSAFMRNIEASKWIGKPSLLVIEQKDKTGTGMNHFQLRFRQLEQKSQGPEAAA